MLMMLKTFSGMQMEEKVMDSYDMQLIHPNGRK